MSEKIAGISEYRFKDRIITRVPSELSNSDRFGTWKARWGIKRMNFKVEPGLYAVGNPNESSPVMVSANYKMSFDALRSNLKGIDAWILVLDTNGINVWCAAGKGTFGTDELLSRIDAVKLTEIVSHKKLIVPQLGATGVSAHKVKKLSGFSVIYGPVYARDIPAFLSSGMKATAEMRRVRFELMDRLVLIPLELVAGFGYLLLTAAVFFMLSGLNSAGYSTSSILSYGFLSFGLLLLAYLTGTALGPILLPWLPGRAFSVKGFWLGLAVGLLVLIFGLRDLSLFGNPLSLISWVMIISALTSFILMNFTGSSTYTSLSGVVKEMKAAMPWQIFGGIAGLLLWIAGRIW